MVITLPKIYSNVPAKAGKEKIIFPNVDEKMAENVKKKISSVLVFCQFYPNVSTTSAFLYKLT